MQETYWIAESPDDFEIFTKTFLQRKPKYGVKRYSDGATWRTVNKPLHDGQVKRHLNGEIAVAGIGPWYPQWGIFDVDDRSASEAEEIRGRVGLNEKNSLRFSSESENSWHILLKPYLNGEPPTLWQFNKILTYTAAQEGVEVYPQEKRLVRLPFGRGQELQDRIGGHLLYQRELLHEFLKLEPFDISTLDLEPELPFQGTIGRGLILPTHSGFMAKAAEYYEHGLQGPSTRSEAEWHVICLLFRDLGLSPEQIFHETWKWLSKMHNGHSKDFVKYKAAVKRQIRAQITWLINHTTMDKKFPDRVHNAHNGYITNADLPLILEVAGGSIPRARFLFHILKYGYPRRHRAAINVHRDRYVEWGSWRTYRRYLAELEKKGILTRSDSYQVEKYSKPIKLNWPFKSESEGVYIEGRAIDSFEGFVKYSLEARQFRELLQAKGANRTTALMATRAIFEGS